MCGGLCAHAEQVKHAPVKRARTGERALDELYSYYQRSEPMLSNVLRDAEFDDYARDAVTPLHAYLEDAAEILIIGRQARGRRRRLLKRTLRHALAFSTWHSLTTNGIERPAAVKLMSALIQAAETDRSLTQTPTR